jgi:hypothetical protein
MYRIFMLGLLFAIGCKSTPPPSPPPQGVSVRVPGAVDINVPLPPGARP